jgi:hypothetical protein
MAMTPSTSASELRLQLPAVLGLIKYPCEYLSGHANVKSELTPYFLIQLRNLIEHVNNTEIQSHDSNLNQQTHFPESYLVRFDMS